MRELIQQCEVCCKFHPAQPQEPLKPHPIPSHPWESVAVDPFSLDGNNFMVTVDYHSGYWEIDQLMSTVSETVIRCLKRHFARYGIPSRVLTDNGPQFSAGGFKQFATNWGFEHVTSSPRFPQSNGKAESAVKTAKSLLRKARMAGEDAWLGILIYGNVPTQGIDTAPVQRFFGRRTRTQVPIRSDLLQEGVYRERVRHDLQERQDKQRKQYDCRAHSIPPLRNGQVVRVKPSQGKEWFKSVVISQVAPRSYLIRTESGTVLRRNRRQLRVSQ